MENRMKGGFAMSSDQIDINSVDPPEATQQVQETED
jgi:hypothetical protein